MVANGLPNGSSVSSSSILPPLHPRGPLPDGFAKAEYAQPSTSKPVRACALVLTTPCSSLLMCIPVVAPCTVNEHVALVVLKLLKSCACTCHRHWLMQSRLSRPQHGMQGPGRCARPFFRTMLAMCKGNACMGCLRAERQALDVVLCGHMHACRPD